jgi:integrase
MWLSGGTRVIDVHALRHMALTRLAPRGVPLAVAQRTAGYADPNITLEHYVRLDMDDLRAALSLQDADARPSRRLSR